MFSRVTKCEECQAKSLNLNLVFSTINFNLCMKTKKVVCSDCIAEMDNIVNWSNWKVLTLV